VRVIIIIITKNVHFVNTEYGKTTNQYFDGVDTKCLSTEGYQVTLLCFFLFLFCDIENIIVLERTSCLLKNAEVCKAFADN
jgi:hypothetical protein